MILLGICWDYSSFLHQQIHFVPLYRLKSVWAELCVQIRASRHRVWSISTNQPRRPGAALHTARCVYTRWLVRWVYRGWGSLNQCVSSFIFPSLPHKRRRSSWNQPEKLGDQSRPTPEQTGWANGPAAFSSPQIRSRARECSQSGHDVNAKAW